MRRNFLSTIFLSSILILSCCDKGPGPRPVKYNVYLGSSDKGILYVLDLDSLVVIDSIPDMGHIDDLVASPDGRWLYAQSYWPPRRVEMIKLDAKTHEKVAILPNDFHCYLTQLKKGTLLLRGGDYCKVELVDPEGPTVIGQLADSICGLRGPLAGVEVAARVGGTSRVRAVNVETGTVRGEYIAHLDQGRTLHVADCVLHPDGRRVLAIAGTGGQIESWFLIGDLETGETLFQHQIYRIQGRIAISGNGKMAAVTDPGITGRFDTPPTVDIFDLVTMTHLKRFSSPPGDLEGYPGQVVFLPGDKRVLSAPLSDGSSAGPLHLFNVENLTVERIIWLPFSDYFAGGIAIGIRN